MSRIRILSEDISNRIAAGEVVERPASVVKELVENSLDAGANRLVIQVEHGGRSLIRVSDDGCGMDSEDALLCLEAHATSKIRDASDIERIITLGFRGEALPSIASVTHFALQTRVPEAAEGTEVLCDGGTIRHVGAVGCAPGTTITARALFYNMPARRKFLRSIATEEAYIQEIVLLQALAHPRVGFELRFDGRVIMTVQPGGDLSTRATMLLGRDTMEAMLPVAHEASGIRVHGFVAKPGLTRASRRDQRTFVNGRPVENEAINFAIRDAYHTMVMKGRYPPVLLFVNLAPDEVDINVHPSKREVRFREPRLVGQVIGGAIRQALQGLAGELVRPAQGRLPEPPMADEVANEAGPTAEELAALMAGEGEPAAAGTAPEGASQPAPPPSPSMPVPRQSPGSRAPSPPVAQVSLLQLTAPEPTAPPPYTPPLPLVPLPAREPHPPAPVGTRDERATTSVSAAQPADIRQLRVLGSIGDLYLVAEGPGGMVLIDQHAAHERIMFERLLEQARRQDGRSQGLLLPQSLELNAPDAALLRQHRGQLEALGFQLEDFGPQSFLISGVPAHFPQTQLPTILRDLLDDLRELPNARRRADEHEVAVAACRAAVKAQDRLSPPEVAQLLRDLADSALPYTCPHGRPTMIALPFAELERRFGRRH